MIFSDNSDINSLSTELEKALKVTRGFNIWLLTFLVQVVIICTGGYLGLFSLLYNHDVTLLGFTILSSWVLLSLSVGYNAYKQVKNTELQEFITEAFMGMGLAATIIGMIIVFSAFFGINVQDLEALKGVVKTVATGMVSSLGPTLCGVVSSYFARFQMTLVNQERSKNSLEKFDTNE